MDNNEIIMKKYKTFSDVYYSDSEEDYIIAIKSNDEAHESFSQNTQELEFNYNIQCNIISSEKKLVDYFHIIKCSKKHELHVKYFLNMFNSFLDSENCSLSDNLCELFSSFIGLFSKPQNRDILSVEGMFCELFTMYYFYSHGINLYEKWQHQDKMSFDFYVKDKLRIDVKSTMKSIRVHHFKHEQLATDIYDIKIISYLNRTSDTGLSLNELINRIYKQKNVLPIHTEKMITNFIANTSNPEILSELKFDEEYLLKNLQIIDANNIPKFPCKQPNGVSNTEYDSDLSVCKYMSLSDFKNWVLN